MRPSKPYWQNYWYDLHFRHEREPAFSPLGPGPLRQVANTTLLTTSISDFADRILAEGADELDDLRGELRVLIYTEPVPPPGTEPAITRTIELAGPAG